MKRNCRIKWCLKLVLVIVLMAPLAGYSQYFLTGQEPANIRWRQINTVHFQLIYPEDYEAKAQQVASIFEKVYEFGFRTLEHPPRKISVILHTHTVKSNGLVAWSPKRVELFTTPHQAIYAQDWLEQLAIHEFRHVVQMDKIQQELPDILPILFGEQAAALAVGAYLPFWFIEGDAVVTETALSHAGRGRKASFLMENKAQSIEDGLYSFDKAYLGSYKDFVPNRYKFGYWMVGGVRQAYGPHVWSNILTEIAGKPLSISPVNRVLKRETGLKQKDLYQKLFEDYSAKWTTELNQLEQTTIRPLTPAPKFPTQYTQAYALNDSTIIAYKQNRADLGRIVKIASGKEQVITTPGQIFQESFSGEENMLIWSERRPDVRWTHADRSVIVVYNMANGKKQEFRYENKLFSPRISLKQLCFAAVEVDKTNRYFLSVFDLTTGKRVQQFGLAGNPFLFTPCWDLQGEKLFFVMLTSAGKSLASLDVNTGKVTKLVEGGFHEIRNPYFENDIIYFTGSFTGIDNIYAYHFDNGKTEQLSSVPFGADYPIRLQDEILFSNYTAKGYQLANLSTSHFLNKPLTDIQPKKYELAEALAQQEGKVLDFEQEEEVTYPSKQYNKLAHIFNFHSWAPVYVDVDNTEVRPGVSLFSQNKLGTAETRLGYEYNWEEEAGKYILGFQYSGFFPVFDFELTSGRRNADFNVIRQVSVPTTAGYTTVNDTVRENIEWKELGFNGEVFIPLRFSQGKYSQYIRPGVEYTYQKVAHTSTTPEGFYKGYYHSLSYQLYLQNAIARSELDLQPRWAQIVDLSYRDGLSGGNDVGSLSAIESYLFFPGLFGNHGIKIYNGYQQKESGTSVTFGNTVRFPRGYNSFQNNEMYTGGIDYVMPLCYPDWNLGRLLYLKRLRTSFFFDYSRANGNIYSDEGEIVARYSSQMKSLGVELMGDGHFLRLISPVSAGVRCAFIPDSKNFYLQMLFSVSLDSL